MKKKTFERYLYQQGYSHETALKILHSQNKFSNWLELKGCVSKQVAHDLVIAYIGYLQNHHHFQARTINIKLSHLRTYYCFLAAKTNPFQDIKVRGQRKVIYPFPHSKDELLEMYQDLAESTWMERRAKILAGFYLFQGLATRDVIALKISSVNLERAELTIPLTRRANRRILPLHPLQMKLLYLSLDELKVNKETYLYQALGKGTDHRWVIKHVQQQLATLKTYKGLMHLRYSVLKNWHKTNNLRQVQYNAGHRYISTTEKLLASDSEELRLAVLEKHPLG